MVGSIVSLFTRGLTLSLEFEGGSTWAVESQDFSRSDAQSVLDEFDAAEGAKFQEATTADGVRVLRITSQVDDVNTGSEVSNALSSTDTTSLLTAIGPFPLSARDLRRGFSQCAREHSANARQPCSRKGCG